MYKYSTLKNIAIAIILTIAIIYALPNIFGSNLAVQISPSDTTVLNASHLQKVDNILKTKKIPFISTTLKDNRILIRFTNSANQLAGQSILKQELDRRFVVALNLAPATPDWLSIIGGKPIYLGLDLRGGVHFLLEVDMDAVISAAIERFYNEARTLLRKQRLYKSIKRQNNTILVEFKNDNLRQQAISLLESDLTDLLIISEDIDSKPYIKLSMKDDSIAETKSAALKQNITTLKNRVNELGVAEPVIQRQGKNRIVVQLPGVQDTARAKEILGAVATLEFRLVDEKNDAQTAIKSGRSPIGSKIYRFRDGRALLLKKRIIATGENITNATSGISQDNNSPMVSITLDNVGGKAMLSTTKKYLHHRMAVVFIENKVETILKDGKIHKKKTRTEDIINAAVIQGVFSNRFQITGLDSTREARNLALLLRAGSLSAPIEIIEERTIGPSLGQDNINKGFISVVIGFVLVLLFMLWQYKVFGMVANIALILNLVMIVTVLSLLQATLTLPGIAGIVLTVGMAVDANVLIFERIREELRASSSAVRKAISSGYDKALLTIADANITTLIAALVLFSFGTGPIKGFAVTLSIGILTSMFTAIIVSRAIVNYIYDKPNVKELKI